MSDATRIRNRYLALLEPDGPSWWTLPLRAAIGFGFLFHGYAKFAHGPAAFGQVLGGLGLPFGVSLAWLTTLTELAGGLAIVLGAFVPLAAVPMIGVLLVAMAIVHLPNGYDGIKLMGFGPDGMLRFGKPGVETDLAYVAGLAALAVGGAGPCSIDRILLRRSAAPARRSRSQTPACADSAPFP